MTKKQFLELAAQGKIALEMIYRFNEPRPFDPRYQGVRKFSRITPSTIYLYNNNGDESCLWDSSSSKYKAMVLTERGTLEIWNKKTNSKDLEYNIIYLEQVLDTPPLEKFYIDFDNTNHYTPIITAYDIYERYNDWLSIADDQKDTDPYDPELIERMEYIRDNYQAIFDSIPHDQKRYTLTDFENLAESI